MKKLALVMTLFFGVATLSYAQDATPGFAKPRNEAEKPVIAKAKADTDEMVKMLKLDEKQALIMLEINVGLERRSADLANYTGADKDAKAAEIESRRWAYYNRYLTPEQLETYKKLKNK